VPSPVVLHLTRPYANAEEYLEREAWSIDARSMVLIDQRELPPDTDIAFDVTLGDGSKPIRAEAKVLGVVPPVEGRPGGLQVRFKRYGAATRAFVERAVAARWAGDGAGQGKGRSEKTSVHPPASVPPPASRPPAATSRSSVPPAAAVPASVPPPASPSSPPSRQSVMPAWDEDKTARFTRAVALAAPMTHEPEVAAPAPLAPPTDRDALLDRLRKRAKDSEDAGE
jgi:hypothetical protein